MPAFLSLLANVLRMRCPRCHQGPLFTHPNAYDLRHVEKMHSHCTVCAQPFSLEPGFYFGATYVSYALSVLWLGAVVALGWGLNDWSLGTVATLAIGGIVALTPVLFRLSRSIWIHFFVKRRR